MSTEDPTVLDGLALMMHSPRLRQRRMDTIPLRGPGAPLTRVQGRVPGDVTTPAELSDLISSIATVGVLQPVLAEEITSDDGPPRIHLVTGERRLRACRWGAAHLPDNPHFDTLPAIICPGPLSEEERRTWQIVENLAREPLRPGEQAAALLWHRCAVLTGKLLRAGKPVPTEVDSLHDPVARWEALERIRGQDPSCAAPWAEVLNRLGLQLSPRKARELVAAFRALPTTISEEMDEARVRLHTRIRFARLRAGRAEAADAIWAAVRASGSTPLLTGAVQAATDDPGLDAEEAVARARAQRLEADQARSQALTRGPAGVPDEVVAAVAAENEPAPAQEAVAPSPAQETAAPSPEPTVNHGPVQDGGGGEQALTEALTTLRSLAAGLRTGATVIDRFSRGSLLLLIDEIRTHLAHDEEAPA
ncbi:ParB N-terminal domain-containing protein [Nocardiopsis dassonvillei]|uniref:ParB/RepB/Spo0J family partition protein n=1 Tax=Nocardiopsis dassonvillei TaxID=2014 RepID=UPI00200C7476|nr:ParB N-terminal domain-containing protein [Nocardiopsis dassonvillei]MCK9871345.1 ParB N-terminal domain-containing protein [Nocardiopsis dassonvillei]